MTPSQSSKSVLLREFNTKRSLQETAGYEPRSMEAQRKHYFHGKEIATPAYCHIMASILEHCVRCEERIVQAVRRRAGELYLEYCRSFYLSSRWCWGKLEQS